MWANLHLLFWLSLFPFATGWMGENHFAKVPVAFYGMVLLGAGAAYFILQRTIVRHEGQDSLVSRAVGRDVKGILSLTLYILALALVSWNRWIAVAMYVTVAVTWFVPDRRLENISRNSSLVN